jgi:microcystin-dependent protein
VSINTADRLCVGTVDSISGYPETVSWQGYLIAGDIIRPHTEGTAASAAPDRTQFTMSKVGKPNVTGVDVTPFVQMPFEKAAVGEITAFAGNIDGDYYLACDGSAVNRGTYAQLFAAIGTTYGVGDGSTTFNTPDLRGVFLRGLDAGRGLDSGRVLGSYQDDAFQGHGHNWRGNKTFNVGGGGSTWLPAGNRAGDTNYTDGSGGGIDDIIQAPSAQGSNGTPRTAAETRPKNVAVNYGIRFKTATDTILTAPETFSTDTASLQYAPSSSYTLSTLENAPVGTFITFTYAANTNTRTQTTTRPTQTDADMNANGMRIFARAYNAASTSGNPSAIAIQIGKGLKGKSLDLYKSAGKTTAGSLDLTVTGGDAFQRGLMSKDYNESTGILVLDAGEARSTAVTSYNFQFSDVSQQNNGYLVINASKSPALTGVPLVQPRIATLSDVKANGTAGGTATAGSYQTRALNTLSDPSGIVTSLASNQFTLPAGEYYIEASAPSFNCEMHKTRIQNITDSTTSILGAHGYSRVTTNASTASSLKGYITISSSKTFELQHRVGTTQATTGFGLAASFGDSEVYSIVKITKVK